MSVLVYTESWGGYFRKVLLRAFSYKWNCVKNVKNKCESLYL